MVFGAVQLLAAPNEQLICPAEEEQLPREAGLIDVSLQRSAAHV